jgi:hypothetical protein
MVLLNRKAAKIIQKSDEIFLLKLSLRFEFFFRSMKDQFGGSINLIL